MVGLFFRQLMTLWRMCPVNMCNLPDFCGRFVRYLLLNNRTMGRRKDERMVNALSKACFDAKDFGDTMRSMEEYV